jgi:hypothetical protein
MYVSMCLIKDRYGTWIVRKKVPEHLQEAVARVLDNSKERQAYLQKSTGTKDKREATRLAPAILVEFAETGWGGCAASRAAVARYATAI